MTASALPSVALSVLFLVTHLPGGGLAISHLVV
jgi:hypothetical protein